MPTTHFLCSPTQQISDLLTRQFLYVDERRWDRLGAEVFATEVRSVLCAATTDASCGWPIGGDRGQ